MKARRPVQRRTIGRDEYLGIVYGSPNSSALLSAMGFLISDHIDFTFCVWERSKDGG